MNKASRYISTIVIVLFVLGLLVESSWYYYSYYVPKHEAKLVTMSIEQSKPAREAYNAGEYDQSIENLQSLISKAPNKSERGRLQLLLASSLVARNQGGDFVQGAKLYVGITKDFSIDAWVRALAYKNLAAMVAANNLIFYKNTFTETPFTTFIPPTGTDTQKVQGIYLKLMQISDETYPNSGAEYAIAGGYYAPKIQNNTMATADLTKTAQLMQKYVAEADSRNDQQLYSPNGLLLNELFRARALWVSGSILKNKTTREQEDGFKKAMALSQQYPQTSPSVVGATLAIRFYYADFLLQSSGATRSKDIQDLLIPFGQPHSTATLGSLGLVGNLKYASDSNYAKIEALKLAKISSDFETFLSATGVK